MPLIYLQIPNYPDAQDPGQTFTAFAKINSLNADFENDKGQIRLGVYRSLNAMNSNANKVDDIIIPAGGTAIRNGPRNGNTFPDITTIQSDNNDHWAAIWQYLFNKLITLNGFTNATVEVSQ